MGKKFYGHADRSAFFGAAKARAGLREAAVKVILKEYEDKNPGFVNPSNDDKYMPCPGTYSFCTLSS